MLKKVTYIKYIVKKAFKSLLTKFAYKLKK